MPSAYAAFSVAPTIASAGVSRNHGAASPIVAASDVAWIDEQ